MSNCNSSNIIDIPQAFNGSDGTSAYVYIAYATTVTAGNPDTVTGFSNDVPTGASEWIGIITTNTPITTPVATDFDNHWFNFKGAPGLPGVNLENFNVAVAGGPFTTLNFLAAGLTGVTVTNSGGGEAAINIVTAALNKMYRADFLVAMANSTLIPGASYWIVDAGDGENLNANNYEMPAGYYNLTGAALQNFNHKAGIIVRAAENNIIDVSAIYLARVPNRTSVPTLFTPGTSYTSGAFVENFNSIFTLTGATGTYTTDPSNDPANWLFITRDNSVRYNSEIHTCLYDVVTNTVISRADNKGNYLKNIFLNGSNEIMKKCFRWGTSDVVGNRIHFYDDTTQNTNTRIPLFNNALVNYSTIKVLKYNEVDTNLSMSSITGSLQYGSRIINNNLQQSTFNSNKLSNAIISNIDDRSVGAMKFEVNTIHDSVLNNVNFGNFYNNTITDNTVLGDLYYAPNFITPPDVNTTNFTKEAILNNLGSKRWSVVTNSGTSTINSTGSLITLNGTVTTTSLAGSIGEIVFFNASGTAETINKYHIVTTAPTSNSFNISTTLTLSYTGDLSLIFYHPSVKTSFTDMSNNIIKYSVIRGLNKGTRGGTFQKNTLTTVFFENYSQHINPANGPFAFYLSIPGAEIGTFINNEIRDTLLTNNNISGNFSSNDIKGSNIFNNGNNTATSPNLGFRGSFYDNKLNGIYKSTTGGANTGTSSSLVTITNSGLELVSGVISTVKDNIIEYGNRIDSCIFAAGSITQNCILRGTPIKANQIGPYYPGWIDVRVGVYTVPRKDAVVSGIVTEGRGGGLRDFTFKNSEPREAPTFAGDTSAAINQNLVIRDLSIVGSGGVSQLGDSFNPTLYYRPINNIRAFTYTENAAIPVTLPSPADGTYGQTTYQTTTYTLTVTTQSPHLLNLSQSSTVLLNIADTTNINFNFVSAIAFAPGRTLGYYSTVTDYNGTVTQGYFVCTINSITNDYTFVCTTANTNTPYGSYLLHSSNAVTDQIVYVAGVPTPLAVGAGALDGGAGIVGTFADTGVAVVTYPYTFNTVARNLDFYGAEYGAFNVVTPNYSEAFTRVALQVNPSPAVTPTSTSRNIYVYADYSTSANILYNNSTRALTLPRYFEKMGCTVMFGTHDSTGLSNAAGTITGMTWTRTAGSTTINVTTIRPHGFTATVTSLNVTNSSDLTTIPTASYVVQTTPTPTTFTITGVNTGATNGTFRQINVRVPFQVDTITNLAEGIPFKFVTTPGCDVQFNLVAVGSATANTIMKDGAATSYTIKAYYTGTNFIYDEIVLMKQNNTIKIISKVIHQ
jgi:hypothetical protein